jgi:hypothetical protein
VRYDFVIETYETERLKALSVWTMFTDEDLRARPHPQDKRGRSFQEQMVHQGARTSPRWAALSRVGDPMGGEAPRPPGNTLAYADLNRTAIITFLGAQEGAPCGVDSHYMFRSFPPRCLGRLVPLPS